jgi:HD-GYP domain-containing protein (c-di-GMP phosphodiesterase class II)
MSKYIDLLRAHQQKPADSKPADAPDTAATEDAATFDAIEGLLSEESSPLPSDDMHELLPEELPSETASDEATPARITTAESGAAQDWLKGCINHTLSLFRAAERNEAASLDRLVAHLNTLLDRISNDPDAVDALELDISRHTFHLEEIDASLGSLVQKSIMMMLYAIKVGLQLKLSRAELLTETLAAMLHHIGMAQVPASIRNKKEKLTQEELATIRKAPEHAYHFLESCGVTDSAILQAARQAQERHDGSGPAGLSGSEIAFSARLTSLLSMFEALIHYRPYRKRLLPRDAIRELVNHHKQAFDPAILKALIEAISLYPVGTYAQLNSGDIGLVIRVHQRLPLRPVIEIRFNDAVEAIPPREIDLKGQPNLMVKRCMYEENLEELRREQRKHA